MKTIIFFNILDLIIFIHIIVDLDNNMEKILYLFRKL